jgi:phage portal protein BeeE
MPNIWSNLFGRSQPPKMEERLSVDDWAEQWFGYQGMGYPITGVGRGRNVEEIGNSFEGYVAGAYKSDGVVFACITARQMIFSEARFQFQRLRAGRPGDLFGNNDLRVLEHPWPNGTTGELLSRALQDADLAGNHYIVRNGPRIRRLRPDWTDIILTAPPEDAVETDVAGYLYRPGNTQDKDLWKLYPIDGSQGRIAHWAPIPDPTAQYRGMSWITPVIREITSDKAATEHKGKFFENAATPNLAVSFKETVTEEQFRKFMQAMNEGKHGVEHAYETLYLGGGADVTVVGTDLQQMDFKVTQGAGETRIAAAARVHPVIVGLSEGMQGSSLNAGNFKAAKDAFADGTLRPLWRSICAAYEPIILLPPDSRLWYDDRDIPFLREDRKDLSEIQAQEASTIAKLVQDGYTPDSVVEAVLKEDWRLLKHTGLFSVQLQPPLPEGGQPAAPKPGAPGAQPAPVKPAAGAPKPTAPKPTPKPGPSKPAGD